VIKKNEIIIQRINKYFWSLVNNSLLIFILALFFTISTIQVNGAKEQFERTKPHVNTTTIDATSNVDDGLSGPKDLGGHRLAISLGGSNPFPIKQVSRDLFKSTRSYSGGQFAFQIDGGESIGYFHSWLREFIAGQQSTRSGKIYLLTKNNREKEVRKFYDAIITEVKFPTLDRSSTKPGYLTIKVKTERERFAKVKNVKHKLNTDPKLWQASNFRVEIGGLPCKHVSKVDGFTIKQTVVKDISAVELPKLTVKMVKHKHDWGAWENWYNATRGVKNTSGEMAGSITWLGPDMKTKLSAINISGVRLVSLRKIKGGRFFEAELSVNKMNFKSF